MDRYELIKGLEQEFNGGAKSTVHIDTSNYIQTTNAINSSAYGLDIDTLKKTRNVIEEQERHFETTAKTEEQAQLLAHLFVAKKCVSTIISEKQKAEGVQ